MRQHVFAFLVAPVVWLGIAAVVGTVCHKVEAHSRLAVGTRKTGLVSRTSVTLVREQD